jgi:hypothetical protein
MRDLDSGGRPEQAPAPSEGGGEADDATFSDGEPVPVDQDTAESAALELGAYLAAEAFAAGTLEMPRVPEPGGSGAPPLLEGAGVAIDGTWEGSPLGEGGERLPGSVASPTDADVLAERIRRLERFVATPRPLRIAAGGSRETGRSLLLERRVVAVVLLAVVVLVSVPSLGLDWLAPAVSLPNGYPAGPAMMHDTLRAVGAGDRALLAFEYGPAQADEMALVAGPVIRQLASQGAEVSVASTRPDGLVAARDVLHDAASEGAMPLAEAERIAEDGAYRPGDATGVARLLELGEKPDAIVVIASGFGPLRRWIEQARAIGAPIPVVAATSAAIESVAAAYSSRDSGSLAGYVSGVSGAAYYERIVDGTSDGPAARRLSVLAAGNIAIVLLLVAGAAADLLSRTRAKLSKGR